MNFIPLKRCWWQLQFALILKEPLPHPLPQEKVEKLLSFYVFMLYPIFQTLTPEYTLLCLKGYLDIICSLIWGSFEALYTGADPGFLKEGVHLSLALLQQQ